MQRNGGLSDAELFALRYRLCGAYLRRDEPREALECYQECERRTESRGATR